MLALSPFASPSPVPTDVPPGLLVPKRYNPIVSHLRLTTSQLSLTPHDPVVPTRSYLSLLCIIFSSVLFLQLRPKWPRTHWDHWLRDPKQHKGRECVIPEVRAKAEKMEITCAARPGRSHSAS